MIDIGQHLRALVTVYIYIYIYIKRIHNSSFLNYISIYIPEYVCIHKNSIHKMSFKNLSQQIH